MRDIVIENKVIGKSSNVFLIAEAGVNHNGDLEIAKKMVDKAKEAQVDAIKYQTFITDKLMLKSTPKAKYQKQSDTDNENFYEMIKKYELTKDDFKNLKNYCSKKNIIFLSTPFDDTSVEWLNELDIPAYKVSSGDLNNFPLLKLICSKNKPILISTGMATLEDVKETVHFLKKYEANGIIIFQCTTNYPALYEEINLNVIDTYKKEFPDLILGFSDHSTGFEASIGAVAKGVKVIEKHFTLDKNMEGPDHKASLNPNELINWVLSIRNTEKALGSAIKSPSKNELEIAKMARKSLVTARALKKGDIITEGDIIIKRPGTGIAPKDYQKVIKRKINKDLSKDTIISWEDLL